MSDINNDRWENATEYSIPTSEEFEQVTKELCERALNDAKSQLHPLLQNIELDRLDQRPEFLKAFKCALEHKIAQKLTTWQPGIQAVFMYDEVPIQNIENWDGSIHLLVEVSRLSEAVKTVGKKLDKSLVKYFMQLGWPRLSKCQSILDVQQVTPNEIQHGISYGAMFSAVYNAPIKVWSRDKRAR